MVRKPKFLIIDIIVNIILDYLKNTMHNLFTNAANKEGVLSKKSSETLSNVLEKCLRKSSFLVKLHVLKMNSLTCVFQGFCYKFE